MTVDRFITMTCGFLFFTTATHAAPAGDVEALRGTWLTVSLVNDGKRIFGDGVPAKAGPTASLVYDGDRWTVRVGDKAVASGTFVVDAAATPKTIDLYDDSGGTGKPIDKTKLGVYRLDGDTYTYCLAPAGKARPTELVSKPGSGIACGVSRRKRP